MAYLENILGAFALTLADRLNSRLQSKSGRSEGGTIALNQIASRHNPTIDDLRSSLAVETHSAATRVVARLEADDLITKTKSGTDSRFTHLALTPKGKAVRKSILREKQSFLSDCLSVLNAEERLALEQLMQKMLASMEFDEAGCDRTCRLCDTRTCQHPQCPVQINTD
ncbi:MarR family winged helix-turn-helix transcriptional regulator [Saccharospirillum mangrovi]|uniref:MarR family winged helix-turn-helix transcriptional regulator n=1 Tax=Saccharospirillum mangrovi TaxID=2161747 RepID=UPI000D3A96C6|nr:MarR family winged helix-turn-helix transcriptional regulator [Saccharospirillum mangrovi]